MPISLTIIKPEMDISYATATLVHRDNSKSQYKSPKHFHHLQMLANEKEKQVLRVWSIAGHGKGEDGIGNLLVRHINLLKLILKHWQNQGLIRPFDVMNCCWISRLLSCPVYTWLRNIQSISQSLYLEFVCFELWFL